MKRFGFLLLLVVALTSCAYFQRPKTLRDVKVGLDCIQVINNIPWELVSEKLGTPDEAPLPEPGSDLTENTRMYEGKTIIFYTDLQEFKEDGKTRFHEVITNVEVCVKRR
jgi:hypothetical protein